MNKTMSIEVVGIWDEIVGGEGCCVDSCDPEECKLNPTTGEVYQKLVDFLTDKELKDRVNLTFVNVLTDEVEGHAACKAALEKCYALPITLINGQPRLYGGLSTKKIHAEINAMLKDLERAMEDSSR